MNTPLTIANLETELQSLVYWERFGIHLRGITHDQIEKITRDKPTTDEQKLALYSKWLSVCLNPSWRDVAIALEKAKEIALAEKVNRIRMPTGVGVVEEPKPITVTQRVRESTNDERDYLKVYKDHHIKLMDVIDPCPTELAQKLAHADFIPGSMAENISATSVDISNPKRNVIAMLREVENVLKYCGGPDQQKEKLFSFCEILKSQSPALSMIASQILKKAGHDD